MSMIWLVLAYPLLTHAAIWLREPRLQWLALSALVAIAIFEALKKGRPWAWFTLVLASGVLFLIVNLGGGLYVLYVPPILLPVALLILFARSLRASSVPLITRFAAAMRNVAPEQLPPELSSYTRKVTIIWVVTLSGLTLSALWSAAFATPETWSWLTNVVHYLIMGVLFLCEYIWRRVKFRGLAHPGFLTYIRQLIATRIQSV
jgi:uncharacterized membrane protein